MKGTHVPAKAAFDVCLDFNDAYQLVPQNGGLVPRALPSAGVCDRLSWATAASTYKCECRSSPARGTRFHHQMEGNPDSSQWASSPRTNGAMLLAIGRTVPSQNTNKQTPGWGPPKFQPGSLSESCFLAAGWARPRRPQRHVENTRRNSGTCLKHLWLLDG